MGGSIFVVDGGNLTLQGSSGSMSGGALKGGSAGGSSVFLQGNNGTLTFNPDVGVTLIYSDSIADQTGSGGENNNAGSRGLNLGKPGGSAGGLTLGGANTYTGETTIKAGALKGNVPLKSPLILSGGQYVLDGNRTLGSLAGTGGSVLLGGNILTVGVENLSTTFAGVIEGTGSLVKEGRGVLTLSGDNTYNNEGTRINQGTLKISSDKNLGGFGSIDFFGGTLETSHSMTINRDVLLLEKSGTFDIDEGTTTTLAKPISGNGNVPLVKTGKGTLILGFSGNPYTGGTVINEGILSINAINKLGTTDKGLISTISLV